MSKINPCLWFDNQGEEAAKFYISIFANSKIGKISHYGEAGAAATGQKKGLAMMVEFELDGQKIQALNGGPVFKFTPALSFFVWCESEKEIDELWKKLSMNGTVRMGLDKYPWAQKYGWTSDRYGAEWQLMLSNHQPKMAPAFLFVDKLVGKGEEAINFYISQFKNSKIENIHRDPKTNTVMHATFFLEGQQFVLMEGQGEHNYTFSPAFSLAVNCETQSEIDQYWEKLSQGGSEGQCGWITDKYGVSWQIVPSAMGDLMNDSEPVKADRVMKAMLQMKKLDIEKLKQAYQ